jgi:hypothetical protein
LKSHLTDDFRTCFEKLPQRIQRLARKNYKLWKKDPHHPGLQFKKVGMRMPAYAIRVGMGWRALGVLEEDTIIWFWIGSHAEYDGLLPRL